MSSVTAEGRTSAPESTSSSSSGDRQLRVLQVHAYYQQAGGEDTVVAAERQLLLERGHHVAQYTVHNQLISGMSSLAAGVKTIWNRDTAGILKRHVAEHAPDVIHAHNTFPLVSPALYYAAADLGIPVVQTLHNYRLLCPAAVFYRDGKVCEECLHATPLRGVMHACYRNSRLATAAVASSISVHRMLGTWRHKVQAFIALTEFGKSKFMEGGLPADKIFVKPNFLAADPGVGAGGGGYFLFVGRLSQEKGLATLLEAWGHLPTDIPLKILGDGPLADSVRRAAAPLPAVEVLGSRPRDEVFRLIQDAAAVIFPSEWYEGLSMAVIEALACGTPVIASDLHSLDDLVIEGQNGARFETGSPRALAARVEELFNKPEELRHMRPIARTCYEQRFTASSNYPQLLAIYQQARRATGASLQNKEIFSHAS